MDSRGDSLSRRTDRCFSDDRPEMSLSAAKETSVAILMAMAGDPTNLSSFHDRCFFFDHAFLLHGLFVGFIQISEGLLEITDLLLSTVQFIRGTFRFRLQALERETLPSSSSDDVRLY